jgi:hypothetical protein
MHTEYRLAPLAISNHGKHWWFLKQPGDLLRMYYTHKQDKLPIFWFLVLVGNATSKEQLLCPMQYREVSRRRYLRQTPRLTN